TCADLLPPNKRLRDSYLLRDSVEENINADVLADIKANAAAIEATAEMVVEAGINDGIGIEVNVRVDREYEAESSARGTFEIRMDRVIEPVVVEAATEDYLNLIPIDRIADIKAGQKQLEADILITSGERASLLDHVASLERSNMRLRDTLMMESARVDRFRLHMGFMEDEL
ncbi:hypothetical protein Tco_0130327, partial [Tanacetum coccineum]